MENKQTMIEVQNLCKSFHKLEVLKDISTTFYKNEVVSIIGPSGGGKSTFLRCLNLLEKPTSGHIVFDGVDICDRHQNKNRGSNTRWANTWAWTAGVCILLLSASTGTARSRRGAVRMYRAFR